MAQSQIDQAWRLTGAAMLLAGNIALLLLFWEWLFFTTRPSFFSVLTIGGKFRELLIAAFPVVFLVCLSCLACLPLSLIPSLRAAVRWLYAACAAMLLVPGLTVILDTVTISLFGWGIRNVQANGMHLYLGFVTILFLYLTAKLHARLSAWQDSVPFPAILSLPVVYTVLVGWAFHGLAWSLQFFSVPVESWNAGAQLPNILLVSVDGVDADHLKLYGYSRETTPVLSELARKRTLFIENVTANASKSYSSDISLLTGRFPATLKVFYPPQRLEGEDAYRHLPGVLKSLGYRTFQASTRHYADAYQAGMLAGFDHANGRSARQQPGNIFGLAAHPVARQFLNEVFDRYYFRARRLVGYAASESEFSEVLDPQSIRYFSPDRVRVGDFTEFVNQSPAPFFAHLHLMSTHCCTHAPQKAVFSKGSVAGSDTALMDRYDDTILLADEAFGRAVESLRTTGRLEHTIIVYSSDHPREWDIRKRVPLMFIFPGEGYDGRIRNNAQLVDVAPTLLHAIGQPVPEWMEGVSLLSGEPAPYRPSFGLLSLSSQTMRPFILQKNVAELMHPGPPYFGAGEYLMTVCDRWFSYDVVKGTISSGITSGHSHLCSEAGEMPEERQARKMIEHHLQSRGIGTASNEGG